MRNWRDTVPLRHEMKRMRLYDRIASSDEPEEYEKAAEKYIEELRKDYYDEWRRYLKDFYESV